MKEKVYCKDCIYFILRPYRCAHPGNTTYRDTYYGKVYYYTEYPNKLNKNNDCKWFKKETIPHPPKGGTGQN
jgi:hypothetical protein